MTKPTTQPCANCRCLAIRVPHLLRKLWRGLGALWLVLAVCLPVYCCEVPWHHQPKIDILNVSTLPQKTPRRLVNDRGCGQLCKGELAMEVYHSVWLDATETGRRFGKWTALGHAFQIRELPSRKYRVLHVCECDCGAINLVARDNLRAGRSSCCKSCSLKRFTTHGMSKLPEYRVYSGMIGRCRNPQCPGFSGYGGRGITVCQRWLDSFANFFDDMGPRPTPKHEIDRIDNDGNYEPGNCRWVTRLVNSRNTRQNQYVEYSGKRMTISELSAETGVLYSRLRSRILVLGWPVEDAVSVPRGTKREVFNA